MLLYFYVCANVLFCVRVKECIYNGIKLPFKEKQI